MSEFGTQLISFVQSVTILENSKYLRHKKKSTPDEFSIFS